MTTELSYTARATALEGDPPAIKTDDGALTASLSTPESLGGQGGDGSNAEQLLAAGYAACLLSALRYEALRQGVAITGAAVSCELGLRGGGDSFTAEVRLTATIPGMSETEAQALLAAAQAAWPYAEGRVPQPSASLAPGAEASQGLRNEG